MGTRGAYGFRIDGQDKVTYNHFDSYPSVLGTSVLEFARNNSHDNLVAIAKRIRLLSDTSSPTEEEMKKYGHFFNADVGNRTKTEWYCLLRECQGTLEVYENPDFDVMIDSQSFLTDSLFCEWAYIINLDEGLLEVYQGFNENGSAGGRYAASGSFGGYAGVKLIATYHLDNLPTRERFQEDLEGR